MLVTGYWSFLTNNLRFVLFGFMAAFASSFGQTYFIGVFGPAVQAEFSISHTGWGSIYMLGTLASAALLPFSGRYIDHLPLKRYAVLVLVLLIFACFFASLVSGPLVLIFAIFLLRQSGQGLMSHVSVTTMARYFDTYRGRAIAIATLGFALGEAILPVGAVMLISVVGWRLSYAGTGAALALIFVPAVLWLLVGHDERHATFEATRRAAAGSTGASAGWTVADVLRNKRFYLLLPGITAPSIIMTAMFFHHLNLADAKGWSHQWITGSYAIYALSVVVTSLVTGPLIDRLGAMRIVSSMLTPLVAALVVVALFDVSGIVWVYFIFAGIHVGIAHTAVPAMWAEVYGVANLGAIKSLASAVGVFASALGPFIVGVLLDLGVAIESTCLVFACYTALAAVPLYLALTDKPVSIG